MCGRRGALELTRPGCVYMHVWGRYASAATSSHTATTTHLLSYHAWFPHQSQGHTRSTNKVPGGMKACNVATTIASTVAEVSADRGGARQGAGWWLAQVASSAGLPPTQRSGRCACKGEGWGRG